MKLHPLALLYAFLALSSAGCNCAEKDAGLTAVAVSDRTASQPQLTARELKQSIARDKPFGYHLEPILETVEATPEQRQTITAITEEFRSRIEPLRLARNQLREEFLQALTTSQPGDVLMDKQLELDRAQSALASQYLVMRLRVQEQLTQEQKARFAEYRKSQGWSK